MEIRFKEDKIELDIFIDEFAGQLLKAKATLTLNHHDFIKMVLEANDRDAKAMQHLKKLIRQGEIRLYRYYYNETPGQIKDAYAQLPIAEEDDISQVILSIPERKQ